ncbi:MAG: hypothetical protein JNJ45_01930 [Chthonomonas sp.]|nr:hypothetical protein [Chthonomonas sp.]
MNPKLFLILGAGTTLGLAWQAAPQPDEDVNRQVQELITRECVSCHGANGIGGVRLDSSERIVFHQKLIYRQILSQAMPPHLYESNVKFVGHSRQLNDDDRLLIQKWRKASEIKLPAVVPLEPIRADQVVELTNPEPIPAIGDDQRRVYAFKIDATDQGLSAIQIRPDAANSLRYTSVAIVAAKDVEAAKRVGLTSGTFTGIKPYFATTIAPGSGALRLPAAISLVDDDTMVVLVHHYKATGKPERDRSTVTLSYGKAQPVATVQMEQLNFLIPANKVLEQTLTHEFTDGNSMLSLMPEARNYCAEIEITLIKPKGEPETLYHTRRWDYSFAPALQFAEPVRVEKGSKITARFFYRNDEKCRMNENREPADVKYGKGPDDEVCRLGLAMVPDSAD